MFRTHLVHFCSALQCLKGAATFNIKPKSTESIPVHLRSCDLTEGEGVGGWGVAGVKGSVSHSILLTCREID